MGAVLDVARKTGPKPKPEGRKTSLVAFKCHDDYKVWLLALAKKHRTNPSDLIDRALVQFARLDGHEMPPER